MNSKVRSVGEVLAAVKRRPRSAEVVLCHGVFDTIHPGHIRHLVAAKQHAGLLVVSVTADRHVRKRKIGPHVPAVLRASTLAALELVDYVVIDDHPTALDLIAALQPDVFAKGWEYNGESNSATAQEREAVEAYGGRMLFTPGDVTFSSSELLERGVPDLRYEKLALLMQERGISFADLREVLASLDQIRVHVVGDTIVDSYSRCIPTGGIGKTPTISVRLESVDYFVGGAGIVARHLAAAGTKVTFTTVLGDDANAAFVLDTFSLENPDVKVNFIVDSNRRTTHKNVFVCGNHHLLKVDTVDNQGISDDVLQQICEHINETAADCVVFSDFRHGIFNKTTIPKLTNLLPALAFKVADSQVSSRWGNITEFNQFDLITPNEREARFALGDQDSHIRVIATQLQRQTQSGVVMLKLGERGVVTHLSDFDYLALDSFVESVVDPVGAGDAMLAYATLAMVRTRSPAIATILGSIAAAIECECVGNQPVSWQQMTDRVRMIEESGRCGSW